MIYQNEKWLKVDGYSSKPYHAELFASDFGRVKAVIEGEEIILKQFLTIDGYCSTWVPKPLLGKSVRVHRIICTAFHENPDNKPQVNHKNAIRSDNRPFNLEWCTQKENSQHSKLLDKNVRLKKIKIVPRFDAKTNCCQRFKALRVENGLTQSEFAEILGIKRSLVGAYEEKRAQPSTEIVSKLCSIIDITMDEFYRGVYLSVG